MYCQVHLVKHFQHHRTDSAYDVGNIKFDIDIEEVEEEVNVQTEKVIGSE
jgi:hypothetical protein